MKTVEIVCKKYDEWDKKTQEKILEVHRNINVEYDNWYEGVYEQWKEKLAEMGYDATEEVIVKGNRYEKPAISFSGFWSQGDGASFTGRIDVVKWIETQEPVKYAKILEDIKASILDIDRAEITRYSHHYVHEKSTSVNIDWSTSTDYSGVKEIEEIDKVMNQLQDDIQDHHVEINREIYRDLEKEYEYMTSDEEVAGTLIANEYEMDANGKIW